MFLNERCPWCGRKVNYLEDSIRYKRYTPKFLNFSKCGACNRYYGQNIHDKNGKICLLSFVLIFAVGYFLQNFLFLLLLIVPIIYLLSLPLVRMAEDEQPIYDENEIYTAKVVVKNFTANRNALYFFSDKFDSNPVLENASPIKVRSYNKDQEIIEFSFLYESEKNREYMNNLPVCIYDTNMDYVGKIVISNQ